MAVLESREVRIAAMKINTAEDYKDSLKELSTEVYFMGERIDDIVEHPATKPHVNSAAMTYKMAELP